MSKIEFLTMDQILKADDRATEIIDVPEWGGKIKIGAMSAGKRDDYEAQLWQAQQDGGNVTMLQNIRARLVATCLVEPKAGAKHISKLAEKSAAVMDRVFTECKRINGMRDEDGEEVEKNS